jgi:DNA-binding MarR family transcriptional regulator
MSPQYKPQDLDPVIHERARLAIVSALAVASEMSFTELRETLSLTDGNLSAHARTLEEKGYVQVRKSFRGRRPLTTLSLTRKGRQAFQRYLDALRGVIEGREIGPRGREPGQGGN